MYNTLTWILNTNIQECLVYGSVAIQLVKHIKTNPFPDVNINLLFIILAGLSCPWLHSYHAHDYLTYHSYFHTLKTSMALAFQLIYCPTSLSLIMSVFFLLILCFLHDFVIMWYILLLMVST